MTQGALSINVIANVFLIVMHYQKPYPVCSKQGKLLKKHNGHMIFGAKMSHLTLFVKN